MGFSLAQWRINSGEPDGKHINTTTAEIPACSLANFYRQHVDRHMNLQIMRYVNK